MKRPKLWLFGPLVFVVGYPAALCQQHAVLAKAQVNPHSPITNLCATRVQVPVYNEYKRKLLRSIKNQEVVP